MRSPGPFLEHRKKHHRGLHRCHAPPATHAITCSHCCFSYSRVTLLVRQPLLPLPRPAGLGMQAWRGVDGECEQSHMPALCSRPNGVHHEQADPACSTALCCNVLRPPRGRGEPAFLTRPKAMWPSPRAMSRPGCLETRPRCTHCTVDLRPVCTCSGNVAPVDNAPRTACGAHGGIIALKLGCPAPLCTHRGPDVALATGRRSYCGAGCRAAMRRAARSLDGGPTAA